MKIANDGSQVFRVRANELRTTLVAKVAGI